MAVLENCCGITEDEVHCATDFALSVELAHGVSVEAVLVTKDPTSEEHREV